jgi:phage shock protein PspC (stress-responsive transcriptional regulator)
MKRLLRSNNRMLGGVCAGIAEYWSQSDKEADVDTPMLAEIDPTWVRLLWALFTALTGGVGILVYAICWVIIPKR